MRSFTISDGAVRRQTSVEKQKGQYDQQKVFLQRIFGRRSGWPARRFESFVLYSAIFGHLPALFNVSSR